MRHRAVTTVLVGARSPAEIALDVDFADAAIADDALAEIASTS
jgi:hypothetical protein